MSQTLRVFVVEDQPQILDSLVRILSAAPGIEVCGQARSAEEALQSVFDAAPRVVLSDLGLPGIDGIELTRAIKARAPDIEVLVFTVFDEEERVIEAVRAGAAGYLLKGAPGAKIVEAIEEVAGGGSVIQPSLARRLLAHFHAPAEPTPPALTPREKEILQLIAKGLTNREVAGVLGLSRATVRTHLEHIYEKLEVTNRVEAITEGLRKGLIEV
ncbi:MAG TPA: response regulator transcription factor [Fredinandcohnia sp.]|nr:response regulator transcription factor [Fredinandcohnia sp.]